MRKNPDIVLFIIDCGRADRLPCYGYKGVNLPNVAGFAEKSIVYDRALCSAPYTTASFASYFTGNYPFNHGIRSMWHSSLYPDAVTVAQKLQDKGYNTAAFMGFSGLKSYGIMRGFDYVDQKSNLNRRWGELEGLKLGNDWRNDYKKWLKRNEGDDRPKFLCFHYFFSHAGSDKCIPFRHRGKGKGTGVFRHRNYDAKLAWCDAGFLRLVLKNTDLKNTIFVLAADHGESIFDEKKKEPSHREHLFDDTVRVPLIISCPGEEPRRIKQQVRTVDLFPSIFDKLGWEFGECDGNTKIFKPEKDYTAYFETRPSYTFRKGMCTRKWKVVFNKKKVEAIFDLKKNAKEDIDVGKKLATQYRDKKFKNKEALNLIKILRGMGGVGESKVVKPTDDDMAKKLKALGYM